MSNVFDQFDVTPQAANPFDQFDVAPAPIAAVAAPSHPVAGPSGSLQADIGTRLGSAGTEFLAQAASIPRAITQGVDWLGQKVGINPGADEALASVAPMGVQMFPDYPAAKERAYQMTGATEYVPETMGGRMVQAGLAAAPYGLAGGLRAVAPNIVGATVGEGAAEMMPDHPIAARLFGYLTGAKAASGVGNTIAKTVGMATGTAPASELYQAYKAERVPTDLAGDVTQNRGLQFFQSLGARFPGGAEAMAQKAAEARNAWEAAVERNAAKLGPSATTQEAGQSLQDAAQSWLQDWKANSNANWQAFRAKVPSDTPIAVGNFDQAIKDINQNFGSASNLAKALKPGLGEKLEEALASDISPQGTLPWQAVQAARTRIGEMLESGQPVADTQQSAIKKLYAGLSEDMRNGANAAGPDAARAFNSATGYTAFGHNLIEDHLGKILNASTPEAAAQHALGQVRQGGTRLAALNSPLTLSRNPGDPGAGDLGASVLRQAAEEGPAKLASVLGKMSPEARAQLFGSNAAGVGRVEDIASSLGSSQRLMGNPSGTAPHASVGGSPLVAIEMSRLGHEIAGVPGRVFGGALGMFAPAGVGRIASMIGANPLLSRIYSTELAPFASPSVVSPNALLQMTTPDQRRRSMGAVPANRLLSVP